MVLERPDALLDDFPSVASPLEFRENKTKGLGRRTTVEDLP
jgi:hypothetical protein